MDTAMVARRRVRVLPLALPMHGPVLHLLPNPPVRKLGVEVGLQQQLQV